MTKAQATSAEFRYADRPILNKRVLRLGVAGNYGLTGADIHHAAEQGVRYWVWTPRFKQATPALREILNKDRDKHVVAIMGTAYTAGMVNRGVEKARRLLGTDFIDIYQVSWLGTGSFFSRSIQAALVANKNQGSVKALGCSIHDRKRAAVLARDSILDVLMIRYNAKHPGAETDIFPHLHHRQPIIVSYTATSWRQLLKPVKGIALPPWPGGGRHTPPPLSAALCYRFVLSSPEVHVVLTGPADRAQLDANLAALDQGPLSAEQLQWVRAYGRKIKARKRIPYL